MWTTEQILSFAPDESSKGKARQLAQLEPWSLLGSKEHMLWGKITGSRSRTYQISIDLSGPAFKCSCPSKKFPCKHILALFLLYSQNPHAFRAASNLPEWVKTWQQSRGVLIKQDDTPQRIQRSKSLENRILLMEKGLQDLQQWLEDHLHQGLASLENLPYPEWESIAGRMIDHKLKGVSRRLRQMPLLQASGKDWPERMLAEMADLYLMIKGFERLDELPEPLQQTLLSILGVNTSKSDVLLETPIPDQWDVIGQYSYTDEDNLQVRRTWVYGREKKYWGLILDYVFGNGSFDHHYTFGKTVEAHGHFYPGSFPIRILLDQQSPGVSGPPVHLQGYATIDAFLLAFTKAMQKSPWLMEFPCCLSNVIPVREGRTFGLLDQENKVLPLQVDEKIFWKLLAMSGGYPIHLFGEWTGELLFPLSAEVEGRFVAL